ncbi:MAG: hypothetical protein ISP71_08395 [Flavobacteriales bacterium]|nr:hypothetical protein [Flavobacteriales bacterium]
MEHKIIALSGPVGVGKDSLARLISDYLSQYTPREQHLTLPIAYALKKEVEQEVRDMYGVSSFSENRDEKKLFRDFIIDHSESKRSEDPYHWIEAWMRNFHCVIANSRKDVNLFFVPDLRHAIMPFPDTTYLKFLNAAVIYIEQFSDQDCEKKCVFPYGESEFINDPYLKASADFVFRWKKAEEGETIEDSWQNSPDINDFKQFLSTYING